MKFKKNELIAPIILSALCWLVYPYPAVAMWCVFFMASYSAIANDSIQTIGTFIASNSDKKWYYLWIYMGGIFIITVSYSWINYSGDISYGRLASKGLNEAPQNFKFLQVFAPVALLMMTRLKMPVSTSILLLSAFATQASSITSILSKSLFGYVIAFTAAIIVWTITTNLFEKYKNTKPSRIWLPLQWISSGALWSTWIMQDMANVAVVLPRSLTFDQFLVVTSFIFFGLGLLFYLRGDKIQQIVLEKSDIIDVRAATVVDFIYACLLYYLKVISSIPISTTWVFIGLLGGREIAINLRKNGGDYKKALKMIGKDTLFAAIGLIVSLIIALSINDNMRNQLFN
ncbi:MAG: hypothetical protein CMB81_02895 [Flammeovirgaceae bacterium]|jgi:hypothetical protein|nr:hypothetical protein [Flammeovirgaceae bacterium]|tara:strand:- start:1672 stop:2703 length:1032 start_codon:yes stop_codon:yes gene_type:complete